MAKKRPKKWIAAADIQEGALTAKAKAAGKSITEYCSQGNLTTKSKRQCNLATTFRRMARRGG